MEYRICKKCGIEKELSAKFFYKSGIYFMQWCKICKVEYQKEYDLRNKEAIKENRKENIKSYRLKNRERQKEYSRKYRQTHKEQIRKYQKENDKSIKENKKNSKLKNREKRNKESKIRYKNDPNFRLRTIISRIIGIYLKINNSSKNRSSCLKHITYSIEELKIHLEKQFEPWMTWNNQGKYNVKTWNDNDTTTWTWQLDHIVPQSDLPYTSMDSENFQKCWALENLRPYSAKLNIIDGASKIRHKK